MDKSIVQSLLDCTEIEAGSSLRGCGMKQVPVVLIDNEPVTSSLDDGGPAACTTSGTAQDFCNTLAT